MDEQGTDDEREDVTPEESRPSGAALRKIVLRGSRPVVPTGDRDAIRRIASGLNLSAIEQFQRAVAGPLARSQVFKTSRWLESVLPRPFELPAMRIMADASQTVLGSTSLSGLLAAQEATKRVQHRVVRCWNDAAVHPVIPITWPPARAAAAWYSSQRMPVSFAASIAASASPRTWAPPVLEER